jgi:hypothetical protein
MRLGAAARESEAAADAAPEAGAGWVWDERWGRAVPEDPAALAARQTRREIARLKAAQHRAPDPAYAARIAELTLWLARSFPR